MTKTATKTISGDELMTMLKRHRMAKGLTLRVLAKRIGCSAAACGSWETGRNKPRAKIIPKLAGALDVAPLDLTQFFEPSEMHHGATAK